ncbi:MAG TPA: DoxX family protein [Pyrinomonadaceae bacterium]|nr:DoxX family protein [Pyrinomonadaceae bacterium]
MNIVLWILQILLALLFLAAGVPKLIFSMEKLIAMGPPNQVQLPFLFLRFIGICEVLGALGLVLPGIFGAKKFLTPLAAAALVIIMIGAVVVSAMGPGVAGAIVPAVTGLLCAVVAYGRRDWAK